MLEIKEVINGKEVMMPVTVLSKACKNCVRMDITVNNAEKENRLRCTYLNECKMYANLVNMIIEEDENDE